MHYKQIVQVVTSLFGLVFANITILRFAKHLSYLPSGEVLKDQHGSLFSLLRPLAIDWLLICGFIVQHSFLLPVIKWVLSRIGLATIERSVYVILTSISLQILVVYWKFCTSFIIWNVDITENRLLWWMYTLIHCFAWVQFFVQFVFMDPLELFGVKQVYYSLKGWNDPLIYKSNNLRRLYHYMRHQGLIVLSAVLLVYPIMSIDRILLSIMLTLYMIIAWNPDYSDCIYVDKQAKRKRESFTTGQ